MRGRHFGHEAFDRRGTGRDRLDALRQVLDATLGQGLRIAGTGLGLEVGDLCLDLQPQDLALDVLVGWRERPGLDFGRGAPLVVAADPRQQPAAAGRLLEPADHVLVDGIDAGQLVVVVGGQVRATRRAVGGPGGQCRGAPWADRVGRRVRRGGLVGHGPNATLRRQRFDGPSVTIGSGPITPIRSWPAASS